MAERANLSNAKQRPRALPFSTGIRLIDRFSQRPFDTPASTNTMADNVIWQSSFLRPGGHRLGFVVKSQRMITALISSLFSIRSPLAISWLVITVVIHAFYRELIMRPWPHILQKILKPMLRIKPAVADSDTSTAIIRISRMMRKKNATLHGIPSVVFSRPRHSMFATFMTLSTCAICVITSAGLGMTRIQGVRGWRSRPTTITLTEPMVRPLLVVSMRERNNDETSESLADKAFRFIHVRHYSTFLEENQGKVYDIVRAALKNAEMGRNDPSGSLQKELVTRPTSLKAEQCQLPIIRSSNIGLNLRRRGLCKPPLIDSDPETGTGRKLILPEESSSVRDQTERRLFKTMRWPGPTEIEPLEDRNDMRIFPARYATAFLISGDVFDNIGGDALIDKISDLYLLQTEASKKTLDFQIAGSKNGAIAVVKSATTGANGTVTCAVTVADGGTFGSFKVKDGARIHFVNGTTNVARGAPTTGVVVDPGGNNRSTSVITCDTVPTGTTANDYLTYEGSALKAPHGLNQQPRINRVNCWELLSKDNQQRSLPNSLAVGRNVQRLTGEEAKLITPCQCPV